MRTSRDNRFEGVRIRRSRHDGVFMAQAGEATDFGWWLAPGTQCTGNTFNNLRVAGCGGWASGSMIPLAPTTVIHGANVTLGFN